jgi:hypothetical protein
MPAGSVYVTELSTASTPPLPIATSEGSVTTNVSLPEVPVSVTRAAFAVSWFGLPDFPDSVAPATEVERK